MLSMTGFGRGEAARQGVRVVAQVSSYNHKRAEYRIALPPELAASEPEVRQRLGENVGRGSLRLSADLLRESAEGVKVNLDMALAESLAGQLRQLKQRLGLPGDLELRELFQACPTLLQVQGVALPEEALHELLMTAVTEALDGLQRMRAAEGEALGRDLEQRRQALEEMVVQITALAAGQPRQQLQRLRERLAELQADISFGEDRLVQELVLFADRSDVAEEITRLCSHLVQMQVMFAETGQVGRKLDFLIQEIFREINTIGSKANSGPIAHLVVAFKTELERVREQVQNLE